MLPAAGKSEHHLASVPLAMDHDSPETKMKRKDCSQRAIGPRLQELREAAGISLIAAAAEAGISRQQLWRLETGLSMNPGVGLLMRLAAVYKTDPATIMLPQGSSQENTLSTISLHIGEITDSEWELLEALANRLIARTKI